MFKGLILEFMFYSRVSTVRLTCLTSTLYELHKKYKYLKKIGNW